MLSHKQNSIATKKREFLFLTGIRQVNKGTYLQKVTCNLDPERQIGQAVQKEKNDTKWGKVLEAKASTNRSSSRCL